MINRLTEHFRISDSEQRMDALGSELCFRIVLTGLLFSLPFYLIFPPMFSAVIGLFLSFTLIALAEVIGPRRRLAIAGARSRPAIVRKLASILVWILVHPCFVITVVMFIAAFVGIATNIDFQFMLGLCALSAVSLLFLLMAPRRSENG